MIKKVQGDILLSETQAIAHGIAPHDHFNQGLALSLRERYPAMAKDYRHYCKQQNPKAGNAWLWAGADAVIINLMTQDPAKDERAHPQKASLKNVRGSLKALADIVADEKLTSVAIPRIATGVGGLEWSDVEPVIEETLGGLGIDIVIYDKYVPNTKADEDIKTAA